MGETQKDNGNNKKNIGTIPMSASRSREKITKNSTSLSECSSIANEKDLN